MGYSTGIDKRGRPYKMVNGRRVNAEGQKGKTKKASAHITAAPKEAIHKLLHRWFGNANSGEEVRNLIHQLLHTKFNLWFAVDSKTKVGRSGRLYAMRNMLKLLHDDTDPTSFETPNKDLNYGKFVRHLDEKHGIQVEPPKGTGEEPAPSDDLEILKIVRNAGLDAQRLAKILESYTKSNDSRT